MAWLLLFAMILPLVPQFEIEFSLAAEDDHIATPVYGTPETEIDMNYMIVDEHETVTYAAAGGASGAAIVGNDINFNIVNFGVINFYIDIQKNYQFMPTVAEIWSGNNTNQYTLWQPYCADLPNWVRQQIMKDYGYAVIYDGFIDLNNIGSYKPDGVTRFGEILGYDTYATDGEYWNVSQIASGSGAQGYASTYSNDSQVTKQWALVQAYRAVGVEKMDITTAVFSKYSQAAFNIVGYAKTSIDETGRRYVDIDKSPLSASLGGNIDPEYQGDANPVVQVYVSRTKPDKYVEQAGRDLLNFNVSQEKVSTIDFIMLVADLMEFYGEPTITEQEGYMLLEAYGRKLPYELFPSQLEAVKYLMVRGIIDDPEYVELQSGRTVTLDWYNPIDFETACTILMRVKDKESRLTFKEIQLTTDVGLLQMGYYPQEVAMVGEDMVISGNATEGSAATATHYDYMVKRQDNRALFLADQAVGQASRYGIDEVTPHISPGNAMWYDRVQGSQYLGRDQYGWYHFRIPINTEESTYYINTMHSGNDDPGQYTMQKGGGWYIISGGYASKVGGFSDTDDVSLVDEARRNAALETAVVATSSLTGYGDVGTTVWVLQIPKDYARALSGYNLDTGEYNAGNKRLPCYVGDSYQAGFWYWMYQNKGREYEVYVSPDGEASMNETTGSKKCYIKVIDSGITESSTENYRHIQVGCPDGITFEQAKIAAGVDVVPPGYSSGLLKDGQTPISTTEAYVLRDQRYLVSVDYLIATGYVNNIVPYGDKKYYLSVQDTHPGMAAYNVSSRQNVDVYIDCSREYPLVLYGSLAIKFPSNVAVVWQSNGGYYVDMQVVQGRAFAYSPGFELTEEDQVKYLSTTKEYDTYSDFMRVRAGSPNAYISRANLFDKNGNTVRYLDCSGLSYFANWIALYDMSGSSPVVSVYVVYETGMDCSGWSNYQKYRSDFQEDFNMVPSSETVYIREYQGSPEASLQGDTILSDSNVIYTANGNVLLKLPEEGNLMRYDEFYTESNLANEDDDLKLPLYAVNSALYYSYFVNWYMGSGERQAAAIRYDRDDGGGNFDLMSVSSPTDEANFTNASSLLATNKTGDVVKYAIFGIPAIVSGCVVPGGDTSLFIKNASQYTTYIFAGADYMDDSMGTNVESLKIKGSPFMIHSYYYKLTTPPYTDTAGVYIQLQGAYFEAKDPNGPGGGPNKVNWNVGAPNAITDWLNWLKEAKLQDAEDILTICILAVLTWLPRVFMFLFIILMALAMVANVGAWQIFCDQIFDPYKFISAGRMDVHTVEIKKVVLYSLIALALFGFFQNGLILDIIGWCARAVTGILNR